MHKLPDSYYKTSYWAHFISYVCNGKCPYCIVHGRGPAPYVKELTAEQIVTFWNNLARPEGQRLSLLGGEPTLRKDFLDIVNNLENYYVTFTTNLNTPFYTDLSNIKAIKPKGVLRVNTTFHPHHVSVKDYAKKIHAYRDAGLYVDQTDMVDTPDTDFESYRKEFEKYGIKLGYAPFLGFYKDGKYPVSAEQDKALKEISPAVLYPGANRLDLDHIKRKCGIDDYERYRLQCGGAIKRSILCNHHQHCLLVSSDGSIYKCHYLLYYSLDPIGHIDEIEKLNEPKYERCFHFGYCNWCDIPRITYPVKDVDFPLINSKTGGFITKRREAQSFKKEFNKLTNTEPTPDDFDFYLKIYLYSGVRFGCETAVLGADAFADFLKKKGFSVSTSIDLTKKYELIVNNDAIAPDDTPTYCLNLEVGGVFATKHKFHGEIKHLHSPFARGGWQLMGNLVDPTSLKEDDYFTLFFKQNPQLRMFTLS